MLRLFAKAAQRLRNRSGTRPPPKSQRSGVRPSLEQLESRLVPSATPAGVHLLAPPGGHPPAPPGPPLVEYHGGPLLAHVEVETVYYADPSGELTQQVGSLDTYFGYLADSSYVTMLEQYSTPGYTITGGHLTGNDLLSQSAGPVLDDSDIQTMLEGEIGAGRAPAPDADRLYFVFTPAGTEVTVEGYSSTRDFYGYHFVDPSTQGTIYYAVIPYASAPNLTFAGLTPFQQLTGVSSHELAEAITDPDASTGWFDRQGNEIGDLVAGQFGTLNGFTVQREWSNVDNRGILPGERTAVVDQFLTSPGYLGSLITDTFVSLLHRGPRSDEIDYWRNTIQENNLRDEEFIGGVLSSAEYASLHGGTDNAQWVSAVYPDELGRPARPDEIDYWVRYLQTHSRQDAGTLIVTTPEAEGRMVDTYYQTFLGRAPDEDTRNLYIGGLVGGTLTREHVQALILGSNEYFDLHGSRNEAFVRALYADLLHRTDETQSEVDYWVDLLRQGGG